MLLKLLIILLSRSNNSYLSMSMLIRMCVHMDTHRHTHMHFVKFVL